jgi:hypothetical protein
LSAPVDRSLLQRWEGPLAGTPLSFTLLILRTVSKGGSAQAFRRRHRQCAADDCFDRLGHGRTIAVGRVFVYSA